MFEFFSEALPLGVSSCPLCPVIKLGLYLAREIPNVFMHNRPDKKLRYVHISGYGLDWLAQTVVNHSLDFSSYKNDYFEAFELPYLRNHHWTHPTFLSNLLHSPHIDTQTLWNLRIEGFGVNTSRIACSCELRHGAAFLIDSAQHFAAQ